MYMCVCVFFCVYEYVRPIVVGMDTSLMIAITISYVCVCVYYVCVCQCCDNYSSQVINYHYDYLDFSRTDYHCHYNYFFM